LINLIEGEGGEHFGDLDGDGDVYNPGDGFGLLPNSRSAGYIQTAIEHARFAAGSADATPAIKQNAELLEIAGQNLGEWAAQMRDVALTALESDTMAAAEEPAEQLVTMAELFVSGQDVDGDEVIEPIPEEGGTATMYQYARGMAAMPVLQGMNQIPEAAHEDNHEVNVFQEEGNY
jgi:hypothetical protein